jgi:hypothetical protein
MIDIATLRTSCLSFPEVQEVMHSGNPAFRTKKKIFITLRPLEGTVNLKLDPLEQEAVCKKDKKNIFPVEGGWGRQGWTTVRLAAVKPKVFMEALSTAWYAAAPEKLQEAYRQKNRLD